MTEADGSIFGLIENRLLWRLECGYYEPQSPAGTNVAFFSFNLFLNFSKSENPLFCKCGDDMHSGCNYSCYRVHWLSVVSGTRPGVSPLALSLSANERNHHLSQNKRNLLGWYPKNWQQGQVRWLCEGKGACFLSHIWDPSLILLVT